MFSDYWGETEPDPTEFLALSQQSQHPYLWAEHLMGKAEAIPPPVKRTYSKDHPELEWTLTVIQPCLGLSKLQRHIHSVELRNLLVEVLLAHTTQTEAPLLLLFAMGGVGDMQKSPKAKDAWQPLEKYCLNPPKDSMAKQTPIKFTSPSLRPNTSGGMRMRHGITAELWTCIKASSNLTEVSPAWSWVIFKSLVTSWICCFHPVCSSHFPSPCCYAKGLRIRTIYFPNWTGEGGSFWIISE